VSWMPSFRDVPPIVLAFLVEGDIHS
jgi:hypothetical protein